MSDSLYELLLSALPENGATPNSMYSSQQLPLNGRSRIGVSLSGLLPCLH
jgi:hypothetical protein